MLGIGAWTQKYSATKFQLYNRYMVGSLTMKVFEKLAKSQDIIYTVPIESFRLNGTPYTLHDISIAIDYLYFHVQQ